MEKVDKAINITESVISALLPLALTAVATVIIIESKR